MKEPSARKRDQHGGNIASKWLQNSSKMEPTWLPNGPWRPCGGLLKLLKGLGRPSGGFQGRMGRSWTPLGALLGPKKEVLNGSWPLQEGFQDRFQPSRGPKGSRKGGPEGSQRAHRGAPEGPGEALEASWRPLRALKEACSAKGGLPRAYGSLLDASWSAVGTEKSSLERLLAAPRGIPRQVSAILGAKRLPKGRPKGFKIESSR